MNVLTIGYSKIFQHKVLPALMELDSVSTIEIASISRFDQITLGSKVKRKFKNYDEALAESKAQLVYITTVNSDHTYWTKKALDLGLNVLVDKPAFLKYQDCLDTISSAREKRLNLREAIVYSSHPQIQIVKDEFAKVGDLPTHISVNFSMSGFEHDNFRYSPEKGGGAIYDLASYALTIGGIFFNSEIVDICAVDTSGKSGYSVDTGFSILIMYEGGQTVTGHFGFETEYINQIILLGKKLSVQFERIFTITPEMVNTLNCKTGNKAYSIKVPAGNTFGIFFRTVIEEIDTGNDFTKNYTVMDKLHKNIDKLIKVIK